MHLKGMRIHGLLLIVLATCVPLCTSQTPRPSEKDFEVANELFVKANGQLKNKEYAAALANYESALKILPDQPSILYNGGFSALLNNANDKAVQMFSRLKTLEPDDWQVRAKLVQAYQRLDKIAERDREREELLALRRGGKNKELNEQIEYCRDRFEAGGRTVMAFELFEFKGPRGVRYVFSIMDDSDQEEYRISLGSYDTTNAIWKEMTKPAPREGERLFHLDGYFNNGSHVTYGMIRGEPTYEATKGMVIGILEKKTRPISATIPDAPKKTEQSTDQKKDQ